MDNNNPAQTQVTVNVPAAPQPAVPQVPAPSASPNGSNKVILWFVIGLIIIILAVGGVYFFLSRQQAVAPQTITPSQTSPSPSPQANLENDLNNINVDASGTNNDFVAVDQDLQQL